MNEKVSVVIPVYNTVRFLAATLDSIWNQTYKDYEVIIADNASFNPEVSLFLNSLDKHKPLRVMRLEENNVSTARNEAVRLSNGKYILALDSDDTLHPDFLAKSVAEFRRDPEVKAVRTGVRLFGLRRGKLDLGPYRYEILLSRNAFVVTTLVLREDFVKCGGFDPDFVEGFEDWEFWLRYLGPGAKVVDIPDLLFNYRIRKSSRNHQMTLDQLRKARKMVWEKHRDLYATYFADPVESFEFRLVRYSPEYRAGSLFLKPLSPLRLKRSGGL